MYFTVNKQNNFTIFVPNLNQITFYKVWVNTLTFSSSIIQNLCEKALAKAKAFDNPIFY